jgi:hypothetical protein
MKWEKLYRSELEKSICTIDLATCRIHLTIMKTLLYNEIYSMRNINYKLLIKNSITHIHLPLVYGSGSLIL